METLVIEVRDQKGMALLRDLEALQIIRVLDRKQVHKTKAADRFAGKLSPETAELLDKHIQQSRDEWDRI
ncbi:hypothetical protein [Fibrella aquatica]|jgi:hypothetical protein|uniref:hypothetical protein n=1 Tax=Fibrella aquatica TaxID=3242487 RepID=UPI003522A5FD